MGEIISIQVQIRAHEFRIGYTNDDERVVSVDPDKRELFHESAAGGEKIPCLPLTRAAGTPWTHLHGAHASRPELCRNYLCSRILILGREGNKAGRVQQQGTRSFTTENRILPGLWCRTIRDVPVPDDEKGKNVEDVFTRAEYRVLW